MDFVRIFVMRKFINELTHKKIPFEIIEDILIRTQDINACADFSPAAVQKVYDRNQHTTIIIMRTFMQKTIKILLKSNLIRCSYELFTESIRDDRYRMFKVLGNNLEYYNIDLRGAKILAFDLAVDSKKRSYVEMILIYYKKHNIVIKPKYKFIKSLIKKNDIKIFRLLLEYTTCFLTTLDDHTIIEYSIAEQRDVITTEMLNVLQKLALKNL